MDNDNQVGREVARVKELFLTEAFGSQVRPPKLYSVEDEFRKTKQNRNPVVTLTVLGFVVVFVAAAALTTLLIQRSSQRVQFDIDEFQDVNLTEILDVQKRNENALEAALRELADLESERDGQISEIRDDIAGRVELVSNENIGAQARSARIADLRNEEAQRVSVVEREFGPLIAAKQEEITTIQARIDEYDSRIIEEAKRNEERLNNQQQLFELEKQELTDYYEEKIEELETRAEQDRIELTRQKDELVALLRRNHAAELNMQYLLYNPTFEEPSVSRLLSRNLNPPEVDYSMLPPYEEVLGSESIMSARGFDQLRGSIHDFDLLLSRLEQVPYQNSIPEAFATMRELETIIVARYEYLWSELASNVEVKNTIIADQRRTIAGQEDLIARYEYAVEFLARESRENGYILDARDTDEILIKLNPSVPVRDGSTGYVFREVDDFIGEITVSGDTAVLVNLADPNRPIQPFDIFLIQLQ